MNRATFGAIVIWLGVSSCIKSPDVPDFNEQLQKDEAAIDAYLSANQIDAVKDPSGLRYITTVTGTGRKPAVTERISASYTLHLLNQTQIVEQETIGVELDSLIEGWQIGVPRMNKGSKFTLYIPSGLAWGGATVGPIPAYSNVVFDIELLDDDAQLNLDSLAIDHYLYDTLQLPADTVHQDPSGIRYVFTTVGTGPKHLLTDLIAVKYTGRLLSDKTLFDQKTTLTQFPLSSRLLGWKIAIPMIPTGSQVTIYIPSGLGFGARGSANHLVPANANLIYDLDLSD